MRTTTTIIAAALLSAAVLTPVMATQDAPRKSRKARPTATTPKAARDTGETSAERERRLLRECKGRPNAGACLGYAS